MPCEVYLKIREFGLLQLLESNADVTLVYGLRVSGTSNQFGDRLQSFFPRRG